MLNHCIAILCGLFLLILPIEISANNSDENHIAVEKINADPSILNDKHLKQVELDGLDLRDAIIKNLILEDVKALDAKFTNITFENCTFIKADIRAVFSNVAFKNCRFLSLDDSFHHTKITRFDESVFDSAVVDSIILFYLVLPNSFISSFLTLSTHFENYTHALHITSLHFFSTKI